MGGRGAASSASEAHTLSHSGKLTRMQGPASSEQRGARGAKRGAGKGGGQRVGALVAAAGGQGGVVVVVVVVFFRST